MFNRISIEFCVEWNYYPQAASLAEAIEKKFGKKSELIRSGGGVFEVVADGELIFSKKQQHRFPQNQEVINILEKKWLVGLLKSSHKKLKEAYKRTAW